MKTKILLVLLCISNLINAQNWSQVGTTGFTNFASDGALTFQATSGDPYVIYSNVLDGNKPYVMKFDGTNWVSVGGVVSSEASANVAIEMDPLTNQPVVAYRRTSNSTMDAYKFDGTNWVAIFTNVSSGLTLSNHRLQIVFDALGTIRVAGRRTDQKLTITERTVGGTGPNLIENLIHTNNTYNGDHRYDFTVFDQYYISWEDNFNSSRAGKKAVGSANNSWVYSANNPGTTYKNISGISDENYLAVFNDVLNNNVDEVRVYNGTTNIKSSPAANDIVQLRKSNTDNKLYLMYADDTTEDLKFENYNKNSNAWGTLPNIGLNSSIANFFVKMSINPIDGNMYVLYLDGARVSVKKYTIVPPLNLQKVYVDADATGTGDGSSWANANNSLKDVLSNLSASTTEIWIADGTYKPGSNRGDSFVLSQDNLSVYGGFNGTETSILQRDIANNVTILSGDLNDDDTGVNFTTATRSDNSYHVVKITANNIQLDGVTIQGGHANASSPNNQGAAIDKTETANTLNLKQCTIKNNVSLVAGSVRAWFNINGTANIENCIFDGNLSTYASGLYIGTRNNRTLDVTIVNSLFANNISKNNGGTLGFTGSSAWIRANGTSSTITTDIVNTTFANNTDTGTQGALVNKGTLSLAKTNGTHNVTISNSIFYDNENAPGTTSLAVTQGHATAANLVLVNNSIDEDNFSNLTYLTNTSSTNPIFTSVTDFTLQSGSPAIDTGDNSKIPSGANIDLLGNDRIFNTTVDMGAYEFGATSTDYNLTVNYTNGNVIINPAPTSGTSVNGTYPSGTVLTLTAVPDVGYQFDGWSGDISGNTNPKSLTMDADKIVTATFIQECIVAFTDTNFKNEILANTAINTDNDAKITCIEAAAFTGTLNISNKNIANLDGIESFTGMTQLFAWSNQITAINLSTNVALTRIQLSNNMIANLDVALNPSLNRINIKNNPISLLNVANQTGLIDLEISGTQITNLSLSTNTQLIFIEALNSQLNGLDLSTNNLITSLYIGGPNVTSLDLRNGNLSNINYVETDAAPNLTCIFVDDKTDAVINNWLSHSNNTIVETNAECSVLSVDNFDSVSFAIYPNPTSGILNISTEEQLEKVEVYNYIGQQVLKSNQTQINTSSLSNGMYLLKVYTTNGKVGVKRFIKE